MSRVSQIGPRGEEQNLVGHQSETWKISNRRSCNKDTETSRALTLPILLEWSTSLCWLGDACSDGWPGEGAIPIREAGDTWTIGDPGQVRAAGEGITRPELPGYGDPPLSTIPNDTVVHTTSDENSNTEQLKRRTMKSISHLNIYICRENIHLRLEHLATVKRH